MPRTIEEPVTRTIEDGALKGRTVTTHPCYAQIGANRVNGGAVLYGSDFTHQGSIRIAIQTSELHRDLSYDRYHSDRTLIEVEMSEAQWATFVSSMNIGDGVPCTLTRRDGKMVPSLPKPTPRREKFNEEAAEACKEAFQAIDQLQQMISDTKLSQKQRDELAKTAERIRSSLNSSLPFVLDQFSEHMEEQVEQAKIAVNGYVHSRMTRAGAAALGVDMNGGTLTLTGE